MIREVHFDHSTFQENEHRFEAGTPRIAEAIGWGAALDWLAQWNTDSIHSHSLSLARFAADELRKLPGMRVFGRQAHGDGAVVSFLHENIHANDLGMMLDAKGFAVRTGHHCAQPLLRRFDIAATNRASFWLYNNMQETQNFVDAVKEICQRFA